MKIIEGIRNKSSKGILLTLLIVVLFILMLGEVTLYIVTSINYSYLSSTSSGAFNEGATVRLISSSTQAFLHTSLLTALNTLIYYEGTPSIRGTRFVNNTQYALTSIMINGSLYGTNLTYYMGSATYAQYANSITRLYGLQGATLAFSNISITVFQGSPSTLNATLTGVVVATTPYGVFTNPLFATAGITLNGTYDLSSIARGNPTIINILPKLPAATLIGNSIAASGSKSPYMFAYGTLIVVGSQNLGQAGPTCAANVPAAYLNDKNIILVAYNGFSITQTSCGTGGLITAVPNALTPLSPYLVYPKSSNIFNVIQNNTQALLNGNGIALLNITALQNAIQNINYMSSPYAPTYLDQPLGSFTQRAINGLFSFDAFNRVAAYFNNPSTTGSSNIIVPIKTGLVVTGPFSISLWAQSSVAQSTQTTLGYVGSLINTSQSQGYGFSLALCGNVVNAPCKSGYGIVTSIGTGTTWLTSNTYYPINITPNTWYHIVGTYSANAVALYVNGVKVIANTYVTTGTPIFANAIHPVIIGGCINPTGATPCFSGKMSNIQVYNTVLYPIDVSKLYYGGIGSSPTHTNSLVAWWPLNGNATDFAWNGFSGNPSNLWWPAVTNYYSDPIYQGTLYSYNISGTLEGVVNCGNINQCGTTTLQHLYLTNMGLGMQKGQQVNESTALGLGNALLPTSVSLTANAYIGEKQSLKWIAAASTTPFSNSISMSIWVDPTSANGVILDEYNASVPWQDELLGIANGIGYLGMTMLPSGHVCNSLGVLPLNTWTNIAFTYNGLQGAAANTLNGYVNGAQVSTNTLARAVPAGNQAEFELIGSNDIKSCPISSPVGNFNGSVADFQVFNTALNSIQIQQLYLNNSVIGVTANLIYPLSGTFNNLLNSTREIQPLYTSNYGYFWGCTNANSLNGQCKAMYTGT